MNWESERIEKALVRIEEGQTKQLQEIICLLKQLVDSQTPSFPATTKIDVKVT